MLPVIDAVETSAVAKVPELCLGCIPVFDKIIIGPAAYPDFCKALQSFEIARCLPGADLHPDLELPANNQAQLISASLSMTLPTIPARPSPPVLELKDRV